MAVVIQQMINAEVAGVAFSRRSGASEQCVVEAVYGLGELLVSGRQPPDRDMFDRAICYQPMALRAGDSGTIEEKIAPEDGLSQKLTSEQIREVAAMAVGLEATLGLDAVGMESAMYHGSLHVLQARSVTGMSWGDGAGV